MVNYYQRDPAEITGERLAACRQKLLDVLREVYGYVPPEIAFAVTECVQSAERAGEHHSYLRRTNPKTPPDPDRAAPDRRADPDDEITVPGIMGHRKRDKRS